MHMHPGEFGARKSMRHTIDVEYVSDTRINTRIDGVLGSDAFDVLQAYCNTSTTQSRISNTYMININQKSPESMGI